MWMTGDQLTATVHQQISMEGLVGMVPVVVSMPLLSHTPLEVVAGMEALLEGMEALLEGKGQVLLSQQALWITSMADLTALVQVSMAGRTAPEKTSMEDQTAPEETSMGGQLQTMSILLQASMADKTAWERVSMDDLKTKPLNNMEDLTALLEVSMEGLIVQLLTGSMGAQIVPLADSMEDQTSIADLTALVVASMDNNKKAHELTHTTDKTVLGELTAMGVKTAQEEVNRISTAPVVSSMEGVTAWVVISMEPISMALEEDLGVATLVEEEEEEEEEEEVGEEEEVVAMVPPVVSMASCKHIHDCKSHVIGID